jgi:hypothetical protein
MLFVPSRAGRVSLYHLPSNRGCRVYLSTTWPKLKRDRIARDLTPSEMAAEIVRNATAPTLAATGARRPGKTKKGKGDKTEIGIGVSLPRGWAGPVDSISQSEFYVNRTGIHRVFGVDR